MDRSVWRRPRVLRKYFVVDSKRSRNQMTGFFITMVNYWRIPKHGKT